MRAIVSPGTAKGTVMAPPSKSMAHRILMAAGLAKGTSVIRNVDLSEDIKATLGILKALGCEYSIKNMVVTMQGIGGKHICAAESLDCKESGSTLRFFVPLLLSGGSRARFTGAKRLFERPLDIYEDICKMQGIECSKKEQSLEVEGQLKASHFKIAGNISSQFITGLLFALPLLDEESILEVIPPVESKAYIDMTLETLQMYGIKIRQEGNTFYIPGNQTYEAVNGCVEGDYSNAAFLDAFNLIGGDVHTEGLKENSLQGDQIYRKYFRLLKEAQPKMDIAECPDLGPILIGMAAANQGAVFTGTRRLKIKESDRGTVMAEELRKFGIDVKVDENTIVVSPGTLQKPREILQGHNDHRIVMTLTILCTITGGVIEGCEAVSKSFPSYYKTIEKLGIKVTMNE